MRVSGRLSVALLILVVYTSLTFPVHAAPAWNVQVVDDRAGLAGGLCLALDSTGTAHMAYVNSENGSYFIPGSGYVRSPQYIIYTRLGEEPEVVDRWNQPANGLSGQVSSLALDSNDTPHIVYSIYSFTESNYSAPNVYVLRYATLPGANWSIQRVDQGTGGSLALDSAGNPHIAYMILRHSPGPFVDGTVMYATSNQPLRTVPLEFLLLMFALVLLIGLLIALDYYRERRFAIKAINQR